MFRLSLIAIVSRAHLIALACFASSAISVVAANDMVGSDAIASSKVVNQSMPGTPDPIAWTWISVYGPAFGCDGTVRATEQLADGRLLLGGDFSACGQTAAANIVIYDPTEGSFSPIVRGNINGVNGPVEALERVGTDVYVGGRFNYAGDERVNKIARYDGQQWHALPSGNSIGLLGGEVNALLVDSGTLYVGGSFNSAGGATLNRIASWDGSAWSDMGGGVTSGGLVQVKNLLPDPSQQGSLFVVGDFDQAGGTTVNNLAVWDGSQWSGIVDSDGAIGLLPVPEAAVVWNGELVISSFFSDNGAPVQPDVRRFDGTDWLSVGNNRPNNPPKALVVHSGTLVAGGLFNEIGSDIANGLARLQGSDWVPFEDLANGLQGTVSTLRSVGSNLIIGGRFSQAGGRNASSIARWDGSQFFALTTSDGAGVQGEIGVMGRFQGDLIIGGLFLSAGGEEASRIARFREQGWEPLGEGLSFPPNALLEHDEGLYVGGAFTQSGFQSLLRIARWEGGVWNTVGEGFNSTVNDLAWHQGELYAGGLFTASGASDINRIARFDGTAWQALGDGVDGSIEAIASFDGDLIVAGSFSTAGGVPAEGLARWDGSTWSSLGDGVAGRITTLMVHEDDLYAGGDFDMIDQMPIENVARFDGTSWSVLGSEPPGGVVNALAARDGWLFAAGEFELSGSETSPNLAVFDGLEWQLIGDGDGHGTDWKINALAFALERPDPTRGAGLTPPIFFGGKFGRAGPHTAANISLIVSQSGRLFNDRFETIDGN